MAFVVAMCVPWTAIAAEIASEGPLTRIITSPDLNCQVAHRDDVSFEFFSGELGACGTFLAVDGTLFGPAAIPSGQLGAVTSWEPVSQSGVTGNGSGGDPYRLVTTVDAGAIDLRVEQTDSYRIGEESYRTDVAITNQGPNARDAILYRAADCFLQDSDTGQGRVDDGAPGCVVSQASDARIEQWVPITGNSRYFEGRFGEVWQRIGSQQPFPNECLCDQAVDNGAGLSWDVAIRPGETVVISHLTFFSPEGRQSTTSLRSSVPGPADISLDPVTVAASAAIAAGVVLFIPFPAALFNSTLEEHYAEVMGVVRRFRSWVGRLVMSFLGGIVGRARRRVSGTEHATGVPAAPPTEATASESLYWDTPRGILTFIALSALVYSLLDPTFGFSVLSVATFIGLAIGLVVTVLAFAIPLYLGTRRSGLGFSPHALPATLAIAIGCVIISRIADFQPGYVYGLIIGFAFSRELTKVESGRLDALAIGFGFGVAVVAWLLLPTFRSLGGGETTFLSATLETAAATVVVAGLEAAVIGMLPVRFLPGERVRAWNQRIWIGLLGIATFAFCHILLNPQAGYLSDTTRTSLFTVIWLLALFGGGSVLFWAYFRFRRAPTAVPPVPPPAPAAEPPTGV